MLISYWNYSFKLIGIVVTSTIFSKITIYQEEKKMEIFKRTIDFQCILCKLKDNLARFKVSKQK